MVTCTHSPAAVVNLPDELVPLGRELFGEPWLRHLVSQTKATRFTHSLYGNVTLHSMAHDHVEFCNDYDFGDLPVSTAALDIGANVGDTSIQMHMLNP